MPAGSDDDDAFAAWFRLLETPGVGRVPARRLLSACGSAKAVFAAAPTAWRAIAGAVVADALSRPPPELATRLDAARRWLEAGDDRGWLTPGDAAYPHPLLHAPDPPLLLYWQGDPARLAGRSLAIVGSRHATPQGLDHARSFARALGDAGWRIVSGLADGIDGAAHEGALDSAAGTAAVVGTGLDIVYPRRHAALARRIAETGVMVSEFAPGTPPLPENFPRRNRIIAGLTQGTLVVEAALQSGSLITARLAAEAGREVFAIPGSIHAPQSRGCHHLIRQGAKLVETAQDVVDELGGTPPAAGAATAGRRAAVGTAAGREAEREPGRGDDADDDDDSAATPDPILRALGSDPVTIDALVARTGLGAPTLTVRLLELELQGHVARLPGGLYQRRYTG